MKMTRRFPFFSDFLYLAVMGAYERGTFFQLKEYERGTLTVITIVNERVRGWTSPNKTL